MKGTIVFLAAFFLFFAITLEYQSLPLGKQIYEDIVGVKSDYLVNGLPVAILTIGFINGVIYGLIVYVVHRLITSSVFKKKRNSLKVENPKSSGGGADNEQAPHDNLPPLQHRKEQEQSTKP